MNRRIAVVAGFVLVVAVLSGTAATADDFDTCPPGHTRYTDTNDVEQCRVGDGPMSVGVSTAWNTYYRTVELIPTQAERADGFENFIATVTDGRSKTITVPITDAVEAPSNTKSDCYIDNGETCAAPANAAIAYRVWGSCNSPYTARLLKSNSRVTQVGNSRQFRVHGNPDYQYSNRIAIHYSLTGRQAITRTQDQKSAVSYIGCRLAAGAELVRVLPASRPGMTAAVSRYSPSDQWIENHSTATYDAWPTPRGCHLIITYWPNPDRLASGGSHSNTECLTTSDIDYLNGHGRGIDVSNLPTCPVDPSTFHANKHDRQSCKVRNSLEGGV